MSICFVCWIKVKIIVGWWCTCEQLDNCLDGGWVHFTPITFETVSPLSNICSSNGFLFLSVHFTRFTHAFTLSWWKSETAYNQIQLRSVMGEIASQVLTLLIWVGILSKSNLIHATCLYSKVCFVSSIYVICIKSCHSFPFGLHIRI